MKTIGIAGSRRRNTIGDFIATKSAFFSVFERGDKIVSGGCSQGGDQFAEQLAKDYAITITIHPAEWNHYGKRAGIVRNTDIATEADVLIAVVAPDRKGGTEDTIAKFEAIHKKKAILV
jgi:hypothetical protein